MKNVVLRACAGLYSERLSLKKHINYFKFGVNGRDYNKFPGLFQNFYDLSFFHDFSRPGNDYFRIP